MKQFSHNNDTSHRLVFVIHKHAATRLHYDFRLQVGSKMPSWAIPKGLSLDATVKRLAMQTPDHPLAYKNFEGTIPEGSYGAGTVMIWDEGTYIPEIEIEKGKRELVEDKDVGVKVMKEGLKKGEIKFRLFGKKMNGSFALVKTRGFGPKNSWLVIKHKDEFTQNEYDVNSFDYSVVTHRSMSEISKSNVQKDDKKLKDMKFN